MFVVMDRNTMAPVSVEGKSFAFTYSEIFNNNSKFNKAFLDNANWNKVLKERNERLLKLYKGEELPQYNEVDDIVKYENMKSGNVNE